MKIYHKSSFITGALFAGLLLLFALNILHGSWWQWLFSGALAAKYLYNGLSASADQRNRKLQQHYRETATTLYGRHYALKENLPLLLVAVYLGVGLFLRFVLEIWLPDWFHVVFVLALLVSAFYSIGVQKAITDRIDSMTDDTQ